MLTWASTCARGCRPDAPWWPVGVEEAARRIIALMATSSIRHAPGTEYRALSPIDARDRQELVGLEAGAADQRAVDVGDAHQLLGVGGLDRSAIEDAHPLPRRAEPPDQA